MPKLTANPEHIYAALDALYQPDDVIELRALGMGDRGYPRIDNGYFNDADAVVEAAVTASSWAHGVYVTLNPLAPSLLARKANRFSTAGKGEGAKDHEVVRLRWLPVDIDPVRPSGISSTRQEHRDALSLAAEIGRVLEDMGFPEPLYGDSGNGAHLLVPIDLDPGESPLVKGFLQGLAFRFDTEALKVDTSVANPARIWKLYGTLARKGDNCPERPHRMAKLLQGGCR